MALPGHPPATCPHPLPVVDDLKIRFPGGATIQAPTTTLPDPGDVAAKLLSAVNSALAPLMPLFDIVDAVLGVVKVFEAVKSLNPIAIGSALADFVKLVDKLKQLLPPLSVPLLVKDLVRALRIYVESVRDQVVAIVAQQAKIAVAKEKAATTPALGASVLCAETTTTALYASMKTNAGPVNRLLRVVNLLGSVAGLGEIPGLELAANPADAVLPLTDLVSKLRGIESAIPG